MRQVRSLEEVRLGEIALLAADPNTGVPVDSSGDWLVGEKPYFLCFDSMGEAEAFALKRLDESHLIEWNVYDHRGWLKAITSSGSG